MSDQTIKPMSYIEAALRVLKEAGKPMHYVEITSTARGKGYLAPRGDTPHMSMNSSINQDIKLRKERGESPLFRVEGKGFYSLVESGEARATDISTSSEEAAYRPTDSPMKKVTDADKATAKDAEQTINEILNTLRTKISGNGPAFEVLVKVLLEKMGFINVLLIGGSGDRSIDLKANFSTPTGLIEYIVQAKNIKRKVIPKDMGFFTAAFNKKVNAHHGLFITTSGFSKECRDIASDAHQDIILYDGEELAKLMLEYRIGIIERITYEPDVAFFNDILSYKKVSVAPSQAEAKATEQPPRGKPASFIPTSAVAQSGIALRANYKGQVLEARLVKKNHVIYKGKEYNSPSGAARGATDTSRDGWTFWEYQDPETGDWALLDKLKHKQAQE